jgi:competence protein CoiA
MEAMLIAIRLKDKVRVQARDVDRNHGPFRCEGCGEPVAVRKGQFRVHHFAHQRPAACAYGSGETEEHRRCKTEIYECLLRQPAASHVSLELRLGAVRPDVFARINGIAVAIEVQLSTLSPETIAHRTMEYARLGISVLWLLQESPEMKTGRYSPRSFERWLHAAYFGRAYFWQHGLTVLPYRFANRRQYVQKYDWRDRSGRRQTGGGYERVSRRFKNLVAGRPMHIVRDFRKRKRPEWRRKNLTIPAALLFMDAGRSPMDTAASPPHVPHGTTDAERHYAQE